MGPQVDPEIERNGGAILLPVILLMLVLATAATAMTLQLRTSLRESATRRDRMVLAATADAATRATALALAGAAASRATPPFALDGTSQSCLLADGRRLALSVQDEGGLVDLNKATPDLVSAVLRRAGLSAPDAGAIAKTIAAHRADGPRTATIATDRRREPAGLRKAAVTGKDFVLADELGNLPGIDTALFLRLRPLFTTANRSAGVDPSVAGPAIRALIPKKELTSPAFESMTAPSNHTDFTITASVGLPQGPQFTRQGLFRLDPASGPLGRFTFWSALPIYTVAAVGAENAFCRRVAAALIP